MTKRMLVDATHPEEIRVAIVEDNRLIDLDIETATKEQIKGNIFLGRVTRVEPSLQAAFVDFNGGRQGFLPYNDIHPKYYPEEKKSGKERKEKKNKNGADEKTAADNEEPAIDDDALTDGKEGDETLEAEPISGAEIIDEAPPTEEIKPRFRRRNLPIQKILSRGQTLLVQVVKETRGNKGASLTTHISLAGRYTVLLPENSGGGGISRKITDAQERKKLKEILTSLEVPGQVSLIIRTAGMSCTKREISRDMSYLLRLWKMIQEKSRATSAPALIHEEGDLIIRTIRDLYTTDMAEILIDGQEGYRRGKNFMRLLMPRHVKVVQPYKDRLPLFARYQVEHQIELMHDRKIPLKSGGYLIIDITEALVTIDINSGRSTKEKDVESTAFKTNMQAAEEIGRQLRLRDLGGLIVIDFIDMDDKKHNHEVERQIKEAFKLDRAKVQIGRISQFGLLELSRQRMKPTFSETNRRECPRCKGLGTVRSVESAAVHLFRQIEEEVAKDYCERLIYFTSQEVANYLLNHKREPLMMMEKDHEVTIIIQGDPGLQTPEVRREKVERSKADKESRKSAVEGRKESEQKAETKPDPEKTADPDTSSEPNDDRENTRADGAGEQSAADTPTPEADPENDEEAAPKKRRRRRRRRRGRGQRSAEGEEQAAAGPDGRAEAGLADNAAAPSEPTGTTPASATDGPTPAAPLSAGNDGSTPDPEPAVRNESPSAAAAEPPVEPRTEGQPSEPVATNTEEAQPTAVPGIYVLSSGGDDSGRAAAESPATAPATDEMPAGSPPEDEETEKPAPRPRRRRRRSRSRSRSTTASPETSAPTTPETADDTVPAADPLLLPESPEKVLLPESPEKVLLPESPKPVLLPDNPEPIRLPAAATEEGPADDPVAAPEPAEPEKTEPAPPPAPTGTAPSESKPEENDDEA